MSRYVVLADHPAHSCPSSNASVRSRALDGLGQLPKLAEEAGIRFELEPLHLDPGHRTMTVVEAPNVEAVTKLVFDAGLSQWNTVEVCPATPVAELMGRIGEFPLIFD